MALTRRAPACRTMIPVKVTFMKLRLSAIALAALASSVPMDAASADPLPTSKQLPLSIALEAATEAVAVCARTDYLVTATVVDASGLVKAVAKGDGTYPHTLDTSSGKAYAAVSLGPDFRKDTTSEIVAFVVNNPAFGPLVNLQKVYLVAGGVVIKSGNEVIGAIGVGGPPRGDQDEVCAQAGVAKIAARLK